MKKVMVCLIIGSALGYCIRKMQEEGQFSCFCNSLQDSLCQSKRNFKNAADTAKNEVNNVKNLVNEKTE